MPTEQHSFGARFRANVSPDSALGGQRKDGHRAMSGRLIKLLERL
jgi:hypothetical protein